LPVCQWLLHIDTNILQRYYRGNMEEQDQIINQIADNQRLFATSSILPPAGETHGKRGRPRGFDGTRSRMPSALAQAFKLNGLDWKKDFSDAIKANKRERIKLWLKLLPYMITTTKRAKVGHWKGRPSKAARIALEAMEQDI
jgi:hypothetical protein